MNKNKYDVAIVGAGIAGSLIAHRLSQSGLKVLIIDAGDKAYFDLKTGMDQRQELLDRFYINPVKMPNSAFPDLDYAPSPTQTTLNKYFVQKGPQPFQSTYTRMVGGTTYHWLGTALRYVPGTFKEKTLFGRGADWPMDYHELENWYWEAEKAIGVAGNSDIDLGAPRKKNQPYPMPEILPTYNDRVVQQATEGMMFEGMPVEFNTTPQARNSIPYQDRPPCAGSANCIPICPIQAKYDASVHLKWALNPKLMPGSSSEAVAATAMFKSVLTQVNTNAKGQVASLTVKQPDGSEESVYAKQFVLAMHAVEIPKVLLLSANESYPDGIANGSGVVGRYLMDHDVKITWAQLNTPLYPFRGPQSTCGVESLRSGNFRKNRAAYRIELQNTGASWAAGAPFSNVIEYVNQGLRGKQLREKLAWDVSTQIELNGLIEPEPDFNNYVKPSATLLDPFGIPRPEIHYKIGEYSEKGAESFFNITHQIFKKLGATQIHQVPGWFGAGHLMGTLRMGNNPETSCCDGYGRAHQHSNLFFTGSGLFPTVGSANPTLTIAAVSLRTAEHIIQNFQSVSA
ncbi:FAD-dependent oxidoreductase [Aliikangiella sp. IMCC44359]|uniref:FAD-dependent oxidoreductase n=1 Tax=Aliikangiella sp. IMCC44359 TaxID=3459125 RepID=UPI00403B2122